MRTAGNSLRTTHQSESIFTNLKRAPAGTASFLPRDVPSEHNVLAQCLGSLISLTLGQETSSRAADSKTFLGERWTPRLLKNPNDLEGHTSKESYRQFPENCYAQISKPPKTTRSLKSHAKTKSLGLTAQSGDNPKGDVHTSFKCQKGESLL